MENENKKYSPYPDKEDKINELKEKIEYQTEQKKSTVQKILDKYHTKGSMSTSMRMPVESNSIYLSERVPFCEEKIEKDKISPDINFQKKNQDKKTFPDVRNKFLFDNF